MDGAPDCPLNLQPRHQRTPLVFLIRPIGSPTKPSDKLPWHGRIAYLDLCSAWRTRARAAPMRSFGDSGVFSSARFAALWTAPPAMLAYTCSLRLTSNSSIFF